MPERKTVTLPQVSIGGYGAILNRETKVAVYGRYVRHAEEVDRLQRELAAEIQRRDLAFANLQRSIDPNEEAA
jgi:hypothetical protein